VDSKLLYIAREHESVKRVINTGTTRRQLEISTDLVYVLVETPL
jgi:hypothetical protein